MNELIEQLQALRDRIEKDNESWHRIMDDPEYDESTRDEAVGKSDLADDLMRRLDTLIQQHTHYGDWRDKIPWSALKPEIQWVAMDVDGLWAGYAVHPPVTHEQAGCWRTSGDEDCEVCLLDGVAMPTPPDWRESKVRRPE